MTTGQSSSAHSEIRVPLPGSRFTVTYRSQGERDRALRLAEARQQIAHEGNGNPTWQELTDDERGTTELAARNWLRAAERAGLLAPDNGQEGEADRAELARLRLYADADRQAAQRVRKEWDHGRAAADQENEQ